MVSCLLHRFPAAAHGECAQYSLLLHIVKVVLLAIFPAHAIAAGHLLVKVLRSGQSEYEAGRVGKRRLARARSTRQHAKRCLEVC